MPWVGQQRSSQQPSGWGLLPRDVLVEVVHLADRRDLKSMHLVCTGWRDAVRQGTRELRPRLLKSPDLKQHFPAVKQLHLNQMLDVPSTLCLASLTQLHTLRLQKCWFSGAQSASMLSSLQGLQSLELTDVIGPAADEMDELLGALHGLTRLTINKACVMMKLPILTQLSRLDQLAELTVYDAQHRHLVMGLTQLSALTGLQSLGLHRVGVTNGMLAAMSGLAGLTSLRIPDAFRVTNEGLEHLSRLTALRQFNFCCISRRRDEAITDAGIHHLSRLTSLTDLNLDGHECLTAAGLAWLAEATGLSRLDLARAELWTSGAHFLAPLTSLQELTLSRTYLAAEHLHLLSGLQQLRMLNLSTTLFGDDQAFLLAPLRHLAMLDLSFTPLTNSGLELVCQGRWATLRYLNLDGCPVSTIGVARLLRRTCKLRMWEEGRDELPRWLNVMDVLLVAVCAPNERKLRLAHQRESSTALTLMVGTAVVGAFFLYFSSLLLAFTAVFLFPLAMLAMLCLAVMLTALGCQCAFSLVTRVYHRLMRLITSVLFQGQYAEPHGQV